MMEEEQREAGTRLAVKAFKALGTDPVTSHPTDPRQVRLNPKPQTLDP